MLLCDLLNNNWFTSMRCDSAAEELDQTHEFAIHTHRDNDTATFITGYNGTDQYDSYFILSKEKLVELRDMFDKAIAKFDYFKEQLEMDAQIRASLEDSLKRMVNDPNDDNLNIFIRYKQLLECDPYESLYGSVIVDISWNSMLSNNNNLLVILSRDEFVMNIQDLPFFSEVKDKVQFNIVNPDTRESFDETYKSKMKEINNGVELGLPTEVAKEDIDELKGRILSEIDSKYKK